MGRWATERNNAARARKPKPRPRGSADAGRRGSRARRGRETDARARRRSRDSTESAARDGARGAFRRRDRNTRHWPGRSSMAAERRLPASRPSPATSVRSRPRWGGRRRGDRRESPRRWQVRRCFRAIPRSPPGANASPTMSTAPAELLRRLRQVVVVDQDRDQALAVGPAAGHPRWRGSAAGTGSSRGRRRRRGRAPAPRQSPGRSWRRNCPRSSRRLRTCAGGTRWRAGGDGTVPQAPPKQARHAALAAERDARDGGRAIDAATAALERIEAQREALRQRQSDLEPVLEAARGAPLPRPSERLRLCPIRRRSRSTSKVRGSRGKRGIGGCGQARPSRDQGARNRRRPRATRALRRASRRTGARAKARPSSDMRRRSSARSSWARNAPTLEREPAELDPAIAELERANNESQAQIGEAAAAEREAEGSGCRRRACSRRRQRAFGRHARAPRGRRGARRSPAGAQRRVRAGQSVEKFECVPQRLPEKLGFDADEARDADAEAATLERLTAERERIGPVNLVAEAELAELDAIADERRRGSRRADPGDQSPARLDRQPQPRRAGPAARGL